jgi:hypothetical protein
MSATLLGERAESNMRMLLNDFEEAEAPGRAALERIRAGD